MRPIFSRIGVPLQLNSKSSLIRAKDPRQGWPCSDLLRSVGISELLWKLHERVAQADSLDSILPHEALLAHRAATFFAEACRDRVRKCGHTLLAFGLLDWIYFPV